MLQIKDLHVEYYSKKGIIPAVRGVSFELFESHALGIVGESACGKSTLAKAIIGLIPPHEGRIISGNIILDQQNISALNREQIHKIRGRQIGMIFQDPFNSLNPLLTIGTQVEECFNMRTVKKNHDRQTGKAEAVKLLHAVHIPDAERIYSSYPHQLSGGLRQRVMIAIAISQNPQILIADEPTTALDVTIQRDILSLLSELRNNLRMSLILITHNLAIVANNTVTTMVMYAGKILEESPTRMIFKDPKHPYTQTLISSLPRLKSTHPLKAIPGKPPDLSHIPPGCCFNLRCPYVHSKCYTEEPKLTVHEGRKVRCNLYE
ncbi:MAG: ABC transporter ATP-binding protein [bacterium]